MWSAAFVMTGDRYRFYKPRVGYKESLHNTLSVSQSKVFSPHPLIVIRQLLANHHSTFCWNVR